MSSVIINPSKPSFPRSKSVRKYFERDAGAPLESIFGKLKCPDMIAGIFCLTRYSNGTSSRCVKVFSSISISGSFTCESPSVSPCPGKCFAVGITPAATLPAEKAAPRMPACSGLSPNDLGPMIEDVRSVNRSTVGAKFILMPSALISREI